MIGGGEEEGRGGFSRFDVLGLLSGRGYRTAAEGRGLGVGDWSIEGAWSVYFGDMIPPLFVRCLGISWRCFRCRDSRFLVRIMRNNPAIYIRSVICRLKIFVSPTLPRPFAA